MSLPECHSALAVAANSDTTPSHSVTLPTQFSLQSTCQMNKEGFIAELGLVSRKALHHTVNSNSGVLLEFVV